MAYSDLMLWLACAAAVLIAVYVTGYLIFLFQKHVLAPDKALMCCLISGFVRKKDIQDIIRRGADPDFDNGLPLLTAVRGTVREQAIRGLIECGADVNIVYPNGSSPLFHAVLSGNTKAVECLAAAGAALDCKIKDGSNLLLCAVGAQAYKTARLLVEKYGFDVNSKNNDGVTVLMAASEFCRLDFSFLKWLQKQPSLDMNVSDKEGRNHASYGQNNNYLRFWRFLGLLK